MLKRTLSHLETVYLDEETWKKYFDTCVFTCDIGPGDPLSCNL